MPNSFDDYSTNYNELVDDAIQQTGFDTRSMVNAKLRKLKLLFPSFSDKPIHFLDYGCGVGNLYEQLANFFPKARYTGVDTSKESIQRAQRQFHDYERFQDCGSIDWRSTEYDLIFSAGVFHHIPHGEHTTLIKDLSGLLSKNGQLIIWEHNPLNLFTRKVVGQCIFDKDAVLVRATRLKEHFAEAALGNIHINYTTFFPKHLSALSFLDPYLRWLPLGGQYLITGQRQH